MTDKRRCSGLSKGWWWLLSLLGLALLYILMLSSKWAPIEKDIQVRTTEKLGAIGADQVNVEITKRGRDVLLNGTVPAEADRDKAIETARAVRGVRIVEDNIKILALSSPYFSLSSNLNKITLSGTMPSQKAVDTLLNATTSTYGANNVENKLSIGKHIASPDWVSDIKPLISDLKKIKNAGVEVSENSQKISGIVRTDETKASIFSKFTSIFGDKAVNQLLVQPLKTPSIIANLKDGKVTLEGILGSQKTIDNVINSVAEKVGKENIINKLILNDDYASTNGTINLTGEATSKQSYKLIISAIQQGGKTLDFSVNNKLTLNDLDAKAAEKAEAERIANEKAAAEKAEAERMANEKAAAEKAEAERIANEKAAAEKAEAEHMANEKAAAEKAEAERMANEKAAAEKAEAERMANEKAAAEKAEAERIANEKAAAEKAEAERMANEKETAEKAEAERMANEKAAAEKAEAERMANERIEAERKAAEEAFAEKLAEQQANTKQMQACQTRLNQAMAGKTILFRTNKANIKQNSFPLLNNIVSVIKGCRGQVKNTKIEVSGHTDSRGSDAYNLKLSQRRADAVRTYLENKGIDPSIISSKGYGETKPIASNATVKGRSQNRRITFSVR